MELKKGVLGGLAGGISFVVIGTIIWSVLSSVLMPYYEGPVWKSMEPLSVWLAQLYGYQIVIGIVFGLVFSLLYASIPGEGIRKGVNYGLLLWLVSTIPGMAITFIFFAVPTILIVDWLIEGLIIFIIFGAVLAYVYNKV